MEPYSKDEILTALDELSAAGLEFWSQIPPDVFVAPIGEAWSPADNVRHLTMGTRAVLQGFVAPRFVIAARFGIAFRKSVASPELRDRYRGLLAAGAKAGRFSPKPTAVPEDAGAWQRELVGRCSDSVSSLRRAASGCSDRALDRYRLPHPLLGKLTLREMLFFTLYHFEHHRANVERRLAKA